MQLEPKGDLLYVFPSGFRSALGAKSLRLSAEPYLEGAGKVFPGVMLQGLVFRV